MDSQSLNRDTGNDFQTPTTELVHGFQLFETGMKAVLSDDDIHGSRIHHVSSLYTNPEGRGLKQIAPRVRQKDPRGMGWALWGMDVDWLHALNSDKIEQLHVC